MAEQDWIWGFSTEQSGEERFRPSIGIWGYAKEAPYATSATFNILSGGEYFEFDPNDGKFLRLKGAVLENWAGYEESQHVFEVQVRSTQEWVDEHGTPHTEQFDRVYTYSVQDNAPHLPPGVTLALYEGTTELLHGFSSPDPERVILDLMALGDGAGPATVTLSNDLGGRFALVHIGGNQVEIVATDPSLFDAETNLPVDPNSGSIQPTIELSISDGHQTIKGYIQVIVGDVLPTAPSDDDSTANTVAENAAGGSSVGIDVSSFDPNGGVTSYTLEDDSGLFQIDDDGRVTIRFDAHLNFEDKSQYTIGVKALTSQGIGARSEFTVNIADANDKPAFETSSLEGFHFGSFTYSNTLFLDHPFFEDGGTYLGKIGATDEDHNVLAYSLSGHDAAFFTINTATGALSFKSAPDYDEPADADADNTYEINVIASDGHGGVTTQAVLVGVQNEEEEPVEANQAPTNITLSASSAAEFAKAGTVVGNLSGVDADAGDTFTFKLLDSAGGRFALSGSTLKVANGLLLDYEQAKSDTVTVRVTDSQGHSLDKVLTIAVKDVNPETVTGTSGKDTFVGGSTGDKLSGKAGNDVLKGGGGADKLTGGTGVDDLYAGKDSAKDVFIFAKGDSGTSAKTADQVFDFKSGTDKIDLSDLNLKWGDIDLNEKGPNIAVSIDYKGSSKADMLIQGMDIAHLHKGDFIL